MRRCVSVADISSSIRPSATRSPARSKSRLDRLSSGNAFSVSSAPGSSQSPPYRPLSGFRAMSALPRRCAQMHPTVTAVGIGFRAEPVIDSSCPARRAAQSDRRGQSGHLGRRGRQIRAPRSIRAWLTSPGRGGRPRDTNASARESTVRRVSGSTGSLSIPNRRERTRRTFAVHGGQREVIGDAADGPHAVGPETGQPAEGPGVIGQGAAVLADNDLRGPVKVSGASVIAQALPHLENGLKPRPGEGARVGEALQEALVVRKDGFDARLVEHDLGDPDPVGIPRPPPGQVALLAVVPAEDFPPDAEGFPHRRSRVGHVRIIGTRLPYVRYISHIDMTGP